MERGKALEILYREGLIGRYYGPGYNSWHAVQDWMSDHPRGRGLRPGSYRHSIYLACQQIHADRSRTKSYRPGEPGHKYPDYHRERRTHSDRDP